MVIETKYVKAQWSVIEITGHLGDWKTMVTNVLLIINFMSEIAI